MIPGTMKVQGVAEASGTPYSETTADPTTTTGGFQGFTMVVRSFAVDNDANITSIGVNSTTAATITVKLIIESTATSHEVVVSESFSHGGTGWEDHTLSSSYNTDSSSTYRVGTFSSTNIDATASTARAFRTGDAGVGVYTTGWTANTNTAPAVRVDGTK